MVDKTGARWAAYEVLVRIEEGAFANLALDEHLKGLGKNLSRPDKGLLTELVQGTVKRRLTLDWIIDKRIKNRSRLQIGPRIVLRLGLYQLCFLNRIPDRAAIYETVELAKNKFHSGVASLVNGVLRSWQRDKDTVQWPDEKQSPAEYLSIKHSHPKWIIERWLHRYGFENTELFCRYNNESPVLWVRTNTLKISREGLADKLRAEGCRVDVGKIAPEALAIAESSGIRNLESFQNGLFTVQDESSMLAAHGLEPKPGHLILDACAAPGGKTTHIAQLMKDRGRIVAWDIHSHRVELIRENQRRLGINSIEAYVWNAIGKGDGPLQTMPDDKARSINGIGMDTLRYDRILVDAPCSGLGVLRHRADARWNRKPEDIRQLAETQGQILHNTLSLLAPGGKLLYSTCTTEPEENKQAVERALVAHPDCRKSVLHLPYSKDENGHLLHYQAGSWDIQFLPFIHGLEGFYMAAIEKHYSQPAFR